MQKSGFAERQLWCAVVERALQDAIGPAAASARDETRRPERQDALQWFLENGHDYQMACDAAGIDAEYLRHHVLTQARKKSDELPQVRPAGGDSPQNQRALSTRLRSGWPARKRRQLSRMIS